MIAECSGDLKLYMDAGTLPLDINGSIRRYRRILRRLRKDTLKGVFYFVLKLFIKVSPLFSVLTMSLALSLIR